MPSESRVLRCGNCGANLSPIPGQNVVECGYCAQATYLTATEVNAPARELAAAQARPEPNTLHENLLQGPSSVSPRGRGMRLTTRDMKIEALVPADRAIWPVRGAASTTYGGSWSPSAMVGPPKVFPRYGDIGGAWAPSSSSSPVEWVELEFSSEYPVTALRVYETNKSGSVYAVVDRTSGEELLYAGPPDPRTVSCALEVTLDGPRVIRTLRVYLTNMPGYAEIDTVALLARDVLPLAARPMIPPPTKELSVGAAGWLFAIGLLCVISGVIAAVTTLDSQSSSSPPASTVYIAPAPQALDGTVITVDSPTLEALYARRPEWAFSVVDFSSEYGSPANGAIQALGPPNVYPRSGDIPEAWAPRTSEGGLEHITVAFGSGVPARSVVWVATFNPGAVVRVDDVSNPSAAVTLWQGSDPSTDRDAAAVELVLGTPRSITALRLYLDTSRIISWNEIDAIGLIP
jgi:hypothetical protein